MPSLGADMEQGTFVEWRVAVGDHVRRGDIIAVIDTDKSAVDVEVFETGVVEELLAAPGDELPVGAPLARIRPEHEAAGRPSEPPRPTTAPPSTPSPEPQPAAPAEAEPVAVPGGAGRHHASLVLSPLVRHLADRLEVDPREVTGTGVGGRVTRGDVERAGSARPTARTAPSTVDRPAGRPAAVAAPAAPAAAPGASPLARRRAAEQNIDLAEVQGSGPGGAVRERDLAQPAVRPVPAGSSTSLGKAQPEASGHHLDSMQRSIARLMTTANREIPHYYLQTTIDLHESMQWLDHANARRPASTQLLPAALLLRATALAARAVPRMSGVWRDGTFHPSDAVQLGVAISLRGGGMIAPTISDADQLSVEDTMAALKDLVTRARRANLRSSDLTPGSITVTNLGEQGADSVLGVIHPPQVALVGFGRILERPVAVDGLVGVRPTVIATLAGDHRASDGHLGSRFLSTIDRLLQHPEQL